MMSKRIIGKLKLLFHIAPRGKEVEFLSHPSSWLPGPQIRLDVHGPAEHARRQIL